MSKYKAIEAHYAWTVERARGCPVCLGVAKNRRNAAKQLVAACLKRCSPPTVDELFDIYGRSATKYITETNSNGAPAAVDYQNITAGETK